MRPARLILMIVVLILSGIAQLSAQELLRQGVGAVATYPNTPDGLKRQLQAVLRVRQTNDTQRLDGLMRNLALPDPGAWLLQVFGPEKAPVLTEEYARELNKLQATFMPILDRWANVANVEIHVEPWERQGASAQEHQADVPVPAVTVPVEAYRITLGTREQGSTAWLGSFVYLDGAFRFIGIGADPFWSAPHFTVPSRNFQMAHAIHKVPPMYPADARQQAIEGTVRLRATIARDGVVRELQVIDGHPLLADAAIQAVRKWRYSPALLEGRPVEVPTTIEVDFFVPRFP